MKALKLTEEHKSKLLEMCKVLFSELGSVQLGVKERHGWSADYLVFGIEFSDNNTFVCHWFELCMTHLALKLYDNTEETSNLVERHMTDYEYHISNGILGGDLHPVDYLYEQFKRINPVF